MSPSSLSSSDLQRIALSFLSAFKDLSAADHLAFRAPNCLQVWAPASLNPPAPKSNDAFAAHINDNLLPVMNHFPVTAKEIHINEAGKQITIWATGKPEFKKEAMGDVPSEEWEYTGEYIFILDVGEDGKVVRILEFLDSLATERLRGLMVRARENVGKFGKVW